MTVTFINGDIPFDENAIAFLARIIEEQIAEDLTKEEKEAVRLEQQD